MESEDRNKGGNIMNQHKKCAIYVRVSTEKQEAENQLIALREYAARSGWEIFKEYVDIISGKEKSRPAFDQLFRDAHKLLFDVVLFWDLSRFSRSGTLFTLQKLQELQSLGIDYISYQEQYITTLGPFKDVLISIMATLAKLEREKISERTKAGLIRARKQGKKIGRPPVSKYQQKKVIELYKELRSIRAVSKKMRIGYGTAYNIVQEWKSREERK
ncbi:resolvase [Thermococci archaeon]|nr:MAG: resolvase [Thermococci archaeon]